MKDSMNADSYKDLDWVLSYSDSGFFAVIAPEKIQHEVAERYSGIAAIYDYKKKTGRYSFNNLEKWIQNNSSTKTFFLLNFHLAVQTDDDIKRLNLSRDMLSRLKKTLYFSLLRLQMINLQKARVIFIHILNCGYILKTMCLKFMKSR